MTVRGERFLDFLPMAPHQSNTQLLSVSENVTASVMVAQMADSDAAKKPPVDRSRPIEISSGTGLI